MSAQFPFLAKFLAFIIERHRIYERRAAGQPAPWTTDPILATYRFCNVFRELDRTTIWIRENLREPFENHPDVWFLMAMARLINRPETLALFLPLSANQLWDREHFKTILLREKREGRQVFGGAYIISTGGQPIDKAIYLADSVLDPMWEARAFIRPKSGDALRSFFDRLKQYDGMGSFMAAQVVADVKYTPPFLRYAPPFLYRSQVEDWWTFASSGPGSRRGLNYLLNRDPATHWIENEWRDVLSELALAVRAPLHDAGLPRLHAQDLQNGLCEFSKWRRTELGRGRPKAKFTPTIG